MFHPSERFVVLLVAASMACAGARPGARGSALVGKRIALVAPDLDGNEVDIAAAADGKVRLVDFWATWCEPCKDEMPVLDRMATELGPRGLQVFGISVDERRDQITQFLGEHPVRFPILWDRGAERLGRLHVSFMPVTLVVDRHGVIRYVHQGWDQDHARRQRQQVEALLAEP